MNFQIEESKIVRVTLTKYPLFASEMLKNDLIHKLRKNEEKIICR